MPDLLGTIDAFNDRRQNIVDRITDLLVAVFGGISNFYAPEPQRLALVKVAGILGAGQLGVARLTDAYLARMADDVAAIGMSPAGVPASFAKTLRIGPASHEQVYERGAAEYRRQIALGATESDALDVTLNRVREMASEDLGLAHRNQVQRFNTVRNITYYRRVIRGEGTCGLCAVASDRIYHKADLLPLHGRCRCTVVAVTRKSDPGSQINEDTIGELYGAAGSTYGKDLKRVRVEVFDHGELGPQLRVAGQHIRTVADVAAA